MDDFHQFQSLKASDRVQAAVDLREFKAGLEQHIVWEKEILFPSFETKFRLPGEPPKVMRWEHREIRKYLDSIAKMLARDEFGTAKEEFGLLAVPCPHNQKEEGILYPMIDRFKGAEERAGFFARMSVRAKAGLAVNHVGIPKLINHGNHQT